MDSLDSPRQTSRQPQSLALDLRRSPVRMLRSVPQQLRLLLVLAAGLLSGCGAAVYEERLSRTRELFEYHSNLNQNLQGEWSAPGFGMSMRPPIGYQLQPPPPLPKQLEDGSWEPAPPDPRQPDWLGVELPGLVAAWVKPPKPAATDAFLFLCSNHQRFLDTGADPATFLTDLEAVLQQGLLFTLAEAEAGSPTDPNARFRERIPPLDKFAAAKDFITISVAAGELPHLPPLTANVYQHVNGPIQTAVICIYPKSIAENPDRKLRMALETLRVDGTPPQAQAGPGGTGAPAVGPTNF